MKKALVCDWLETYAGAERCVQSFTDIWDDFEVFSLVDYLKFDDRQKILKGKFYENLANADLLALIQSF